MASSQEEEIKFMPLANKAQKFTTAKGNRFSVSGVLLKVCLVNGKFKDQCTISVTVPSLRFRRGKPSLGTDFQAE